MKLINIFSSNIIRLFICACVHLKISEVERTMEGKKHEKQILCRVT